MSIPSRVKQLERRLVLPEQQGPPFTPEDLALADRIIERTYADPVRFAKRIALFEKVAPELAARRRP